VESRLVLLGGLFLRAGLGPLLAVEHVRAGDIVLARAHQGELDLVLDVFYMEGAALRLAAHERADHAVREPDHDLADPSRGGALAAVHREEGLGHRHRDLGRLEADDRAVAPDDLVVGVGSAPCATRLRNGYAQGGCNRGVFLSNLHVCLSRVFADLRDRPPRCYCGSVTTFRFTCICDPAATTSSAK